MLTAYEYCCQQLQAKNKEKLDSLGINQTIKDLKFCNLPKTRISVHRKRVIAPKGFQTRKSNRHTPSQLKDYKEGQQGSRMSSGSKHNASSQDDPVYDLDEPEGRKLQLIAFFNGMDCFDQQPRSVAKLVEQIQAKQPLVVAGDLAHAEIEVEVLQSFFGVSEKLVADRLWRGLNEKKR